MRNLQQLLNYQLLTNKLFKLLSFNQLFGTNEKDEGASWRAQKTINLVDTYVAVFGCFFYGQCNLEMNRDTVGCVVHIFLL